MSDSKHTKCNYRVLLLEQDKNLLKSIKATPSFKQVKCLTGAGAMSPSQAKALVQSAVSSLSVLQPIFCGWLLAVTNPLSASFLIG